MKTTVPQIAVVQLGARNHYLTAAALEEHGMLQGLYTDAYVRENSWKANIARLVATRYPGRLQAMAGRRGRISDDKVRDSWLITLIALGARSLRRYQVAPAQWDARLSRRLTRFAARHGAGEAAAVFGYSSACPELFSWARGRGVFTILEQASATVAVSTEIMREEYLRWPGWQLGALPDMTLYAQRETDELALTDKILAPSQFVRQSLICAGVAAEKIEVLPYGFDLDVSPPVRTKRHKDDPLRVLFLGNVGLQKGIQYFLEAARSLGNRHYSFRVVGSLGVNPEMLSRYQDVVEFSGAVPRNDVARHYVWADVFVMPTLCDGFGMVQLEAAAHGLPIIATPNCADVVREGIEGYVVPVANAEAIADKLKLLRENPDLVLSFGRAAQSRVNDFSRIHYGRKLVSSLKKSVCNG